MKSLRLGLPELFPMTDGSSLSGLSVEAHVSSIGLLDCKVPRASCERDVCVLLETCAAIDFGSDIIESKCVVVVNLVINYLKQLFCRAPPK